MLFFMLPLLLHAPRRQKTAGTIWQTLHADPSFSLLAAALNATGLAETLDSKGGTGAYTIFAPDNEAIQASPDFPEGN